MSAALFVSHSFPLLSYANLSFSITYIHSSAGPKPSVLGYVCIVEARLEGPALQVATTIRTKVGFASSCPSLVSHSRLAAYRKSIMNREDGALLPTYAITIHPSLYSGSSPL